VEQNLVIVHLQAQVFLAAWRVFQNQTYFEQIFKFKIIFWIYQRSANPPPVLVFCSSETQGESAIPRQDTFSSKY
jgi:hypothetical protein